MFTFKTEKSTGRYRSFYPDWHYIKIKKKVIGQIESEHPHTIRLMVIKKDINEDGNPNCKWKWIRLKKESESVSEAKEWLKENYKLIVTKYELAIFD